MVKISTTAHLAIHNKTNKDNKLITKPIALRVNSVQTALTDLGFIMPFQPTMVRGNKLEVIFAHMQQSIRESLLEKYGKITTDEVLKQVAEVFMSLNYKTFSKSIAVTFPGGNAHISYLNFHATPLVSTDCKGRILNLVSDQRSEPDFLLLFVQAKGLKLYEYSNEYLPLSSYGSFNGLSGYKLPLLRVENNRIKSRSELNKRVGVLTRLLNKEISKPVFVIGAPKLINGICNRNPLSGVMFKKIWYGADFGEQKVQTLATEIANHWSYWQNKFINGKADLAKRTGTLHTELDDVQKALATGVDGTLYIEKKLKQQLDNYSPTTNSLLLNFMARGNKVVLTNNGFLKGFSSIMLLERRWESQPRRKIIRSSRSLRTEVY